MGDRKAGIKHNVLLIKDTLALIHRVGSNPKLSPVTTAKELSTITFYNERHNVKEIRKFV